MTDKQKRFIEEYLIDLNATQAAIRAGYSPDTAQQQSYELMTKPEIAKAVKSEMAERSRRTGIKADRVLEELAKIAFSNIFDVIDYNNAALRPETCPDALAAVQSVRVRSRPDKDWEFIEREVRLFDKVKALELLGEHLGLFGRCASADQPLKITFVKASEC